MSKFHEAVRELLEDVHKFLAVTLNTEILSSTALSSRENLLTKLNVIQQDYPQLHLNFLLKSPCSKSPSRFTSNGEKDESLSPSSPPPYVDMQGNGNSLLSKESVDEDYEVCNSDKNLFHKDYENKFVIDSEEVPADEDKEALPIAAADLAKSEKCGYLEKKGKERLGGLLNPFQRRWCAVKDGILYYFERPSDRRQKGQIALEGYEVKLNRNAIKDVNKRDLCFELICPGRRSFQFIALTPKDLKQWLATIERNNRSDSYKGNSSNGGDSEACDIPRDVIIRSGDSEDDNIYEMVEETNNRNKCSIDDEPLYDEGESYSRTEDEELYTEAESSASQEELDQFDPQEWFVGLWDCKGDDRNELDFFRGDLIRIISKEYDSYAWWIGEVKGKVGLVPKSYLMEAYEAI